MQRRKVIIGRNTTTQQIEVYSNRKKVFKEHERRLSISYNQFCIEIKKGLLISVPQGMGMFGAVVADPVFFKEFEIR